MKRKSGVVVRPGFVSCLTWLWDVSYFLLMNRWVLFTPGDLDEHPKGFIYCFRIRKYLRHIRGKNDDVRALLEFLRIFASDSFGEVILRKDFFVY